jgi:hypothetical protein
MQVHTHQRFQNCVARCRRDVRDDTILISTKPFFDSEAIVLKSSLGIHLINEAPEWRTRALKQGQTGDVQCTIWMR